MNFENQKISSSNQSLFLLTHFTTINDEKCDIFTSEISIIIAILASIMSFITITGNSLVIIAFIIDKSLRTCSNYYLLNLSLADLLIGLLIPTYVPFLLHDYKWKLGRITCLLWLVLDYVICSASVLCIVVISLDRFFLVNKGLDYLSSQSITKSAAIMLSVWLLAFINYAPAILIWEFSFNNESTNKYECKVGFNNNLIYLAVTSCVEFFIPLISICFLNIAIYLNIRKRSKGIILNENNYAKQIKIKKLAESINLKKVSNINFNQRNDSTINIPVTSESSLRASELQSNILQNKKTRLRKDKKAARFLFILVFTFGICWV